MVVAASGVFLGWTGVVMRGLYSITRMVTRVDLYQIWCYNLSAMDTTGYSLSLRRLDKDGLAWAQATVKQHHYLHQPIDPRCSVEGYGIDHAIIGERIGLLLFGRPEATCCKDWYGSVEDVKSSKREVTRWQVLNLARVWISPTVQRGGQFFNQDYIPGFYDRKKIWHSTLASHILNMAIQSIGYDYLLNRPPCFLEEPYEIRYLLSYCNTTLHRGVIYAASGFELYTTNKNLIQTWRIRLPSLTPEQNMHIRHASDVNPRSQKYRAERAQLRLSL